MPEQLLKMLVGIKKLDDNAKIPTYADGGASGFDFYAVHDLTIASGSSGIVGTGVAFEIPTGWEIQVRGRSGLAFKNDIIAHFGTIDESFKGEVKIKLFNFGDKSLQIKTGDRVAQGVLTPVTKADFYELESLSKSKRGEGGFGSTGR